MSKIAKELAWRHDTTAAQTQHSPRDKNISKEIDLFRLMISGKIKQNQELRPKTDMGSSES